MIKEIVFFGDSLTAGYGLAYPEQEAVPALIQQRIDAEGLRYRVRNAGLSGDTSAGGLKRLDTWISGCVDVFVLELGVNDLLRGLPAAATAENLSAIISKVRHKHPGVKIALMGMSLPPQLLLGRATGFHQLYDRIAAAEPKLAYVPFFLDGVAGQRHLNLWDGLHPNAEGYQKITEKIWPTIRPLLD